jgi:hypothetical protein
MTALVSDAARHRISRARYIPAVAWLICAIAWPAFARADVLNLACTQVSSTIPGFSYVRCSGDCKTFTVEIDMSGGIATVSASTAETDPGSYQATITDSTITWSSEHYDVELSRYTGILDEKADPKHGQMLNVLYDWKCSSVQRQF